VFFGSDPLRLYASTPLRRPLHHSNRWFCSLAAQVRADRRMLLPQHHTQYAGLDPSDPFLEPYWALAEAMDIPVMIHTGTSFPGTAYARYPNFRLRLGNPLLLEDVLVKHPKLRLWIAHGGEPWTQETFALMSQYPQVYMDVSTIDWIGGDAGRPAFHRFLAEAIGRGFEKRIMFGSDQMGWPDAILFAINGVDSAPFLTPQQKTDSFYGNAMTFFRANHVAVGAKKVGP
jgi:predicted TIM-barrel fold metal-dependent hydrolase